MREDPNVLRRLVARNPFCWVPAMGYERRIQAIVEQGSWRCFFESVSPRTGG